MSGFDIRNSLYMDGAIVPGNGALRGLGPPPPGGTGRAVHFDGNGGTGGDGLYRTSALGGVVDSATGICSFWFKSSDTINSNSIYQNFIALNSHSTPDVDGGSSGVIIDMNAEANVLLNDGVVSSTEYEQYGKLTEYRDNAWHHVLFAWNTNFTAGSRVTQLAIDGTLVAVVGANGGAAFTVGYDAIGPCIGVQGFDDATNTAQYTSDFDMAEFYFAMGQTLDLATPANIIKFRTALGKPAYMGATGSVPTGTTPAIYLKVAVSDGASTFANNLGTGGNFTITGALTIASTDPY